MDPLFHKESGRLEFKEDEVEQLVTTCVVEDEASGNSGNFIVYLTNLRIFFRETSSLDKPLVHPRHWVIQLERIHHFDVSNSLIFGKRPTLLLYLLSPTSTDLFSVTLVFHSNQVNRFARILSKQIEKKHWLRHAKGSGLSIPKSVFSTSDAGIQGITRWIENKSKGISFSMQEAFKSLDSLFEKAAEMKAIANKLASNTIIKDSEKNSDFEFQHQVMQKMGIRNPVISHGYGGDRDLYCDELAREIDEFLTKNIFIRENSPYLNFLDSTLGKESTKQSDNENLHINKQVITLTDFYCLLNLARGTALVSPDDLLDACKRLKKLNLCASLVNLSENLLAIVSSNYDGETVLQEIAALLEKNGPMTAMQLSVDQCIPLSISKYLLLEAEKKELACRDESIEGLLFWKNIFLHP